MQVELGVLTLKGYFQPGDVIVLDRAVIHTGGANETLEGLVVGKFPYLHIASTSQDTRMEPY